MSSDYLKIGKLYNLNSTSTIGITGASLIHGIYTATNSAITITIDNTYQVYVPLNGITFSNPIAFTGVRTTSVNATGIILYS
jgi:hypothetical protein